MFVCIDMDHLEFIHKHPDHHIVSSLAYLEACDRSTMVCSTDNPLFLSSFSGLEARLLYRNTTGEDITGTDPLVVREMLATIVDDHIPVTTANADELDAQIALVIDDLEKGIPWKYASGSKRPTKQEELFSLHCRPLAPVAAQQAAQRAPQRRAQPSAPKPRPAPESPPQPPRAPKQRMSSVRPTIWAVADRMWGEAGSPTDKAVVLELRKKMMVELEEKHAIKRTSSSNELGNWMKERLA